MTADELTEHMTSPVLLKNTASFVKFGNEYSAEHNNMVVTENKRVFVV